MIHGINTIINCSICKISVGLSFLNWIKKEIICYRTSELMLQRCHRMLCLIRAYMFETQGPLSLIRCCILHLICVYTVCSSLPVPSSTMQNITGLFYILVYIGQSIFLLSVGHITEVILSWCQQTIKQEGHDGPVMLTLVS